MAEAKQESKDERIAKLLNVIRAWIVSESGPTHMTLHDPKLQVRVGIRGYKKIILTRTFGEAQGD